MMTTKEKLIDFIKYKGISKKRFYDITGFSNGFLDSGKYIGTDKLRIVLEKFTDISFNWLILDKGGMIVNSSQKEKYSENKDYSATIESLEKEIKAQAELIEEKERLINEKERLIELLLKK